MWEKAPTAQEATAHHLVLGAEAPDKDGVYARLGDAPVIYLVGKAEAERVLRKTAFDLRNKKLLAFTTDTIHKLRIQSPTAQFTLERASNAWKLVEPQKKDIAQRWKIDHLLYELSLLEYTALVKPEPARHYGLETPQLQLILWQHDGSPIGPLLIGNAVEATESSSKIVYAQVGTQTPFYTLKADFLNGVPKGLAELTTEK